MHPYHAWPFQSAPGHPLLSALWELVAHGSLCLLVVAPFVVRARRPILAAALVVAAGIGVDLDHAVAAKSLSLRAMQTMHGRPDTHSFLVALAIAILAGLVTRRLRAAWVVFAVLAGHLLFDAPGGGTPLLWPIDGPRAVPWLVCPAGIAALLAISVVVARPGSPGWARAIGARARRGRVPA